MQKGKFGIVLCFYPIAAFAAVILNSPLIAAALTAVAVFVERDEWAGRQTVQAWMLSALVWFFDKAVRLMTARLAIPVLSTVLSVVSTVLFVAVYLAAILLSVLAITRTMRGGEANLPFFAELAYRLYGKTRPKPLPPAGQYPPYGAQPPQPGQPVYPGQAPGQQPPYGQPPMPPQYPGAPQPGPVPPQAPVQEPPQQPNP